MNLLEAKQQIANLKQNQDQFTEIENKYLKAMNQQNQHLHVLKKMFSEQVKKNLEIQEINQKLNEKLSFYLKTSKVNQDQLEELLENGLVNNKLVEQVEEWLNLKQGDILQVDFYDPDLELDLSDGGDNEIKGGNLNTHQKIGLLVPVVEKKIVRRHLHIKSHSLNLDLRGKEANKLTFKQLIRTKEEGCIVDDLILYQEAETQTEVSFCARNYQKFICTQSELKNLYDKKLFSDTLMSIVGSREDTNFVRNQSMLQFLEEHLPMYANEELGEYFDKNFKGLGFLKATDINPSLKIKEILTQYAYESQKAALFKEKKDTYSKNAELLYQACLKFKSTLIELDDKYSL